MVLDFGSLKILISSCCWLVISLYITSYHFLYYQFQLKPQAILISLVFGAILGGIGHIAFHVKKNGTSQLSRTIADVIGLIAVSIGTGVVVTTLVISYLQKQGLVDFSAMPDWMIYFWVIGYGTVIVAGGTVLIATLLNIAQTVLLQFRKPNDKE